VGTKGCKKEVIKAILKVFSEIIKEEKDMSKKEEENEVLRARAKGLLSTIHEALHGKEVLAAIGDTNAIVAARAICNILPSPLSVYFDFGRNDHNMTLKFNVPLALALKTGNEQAEVDALVKFDPSLAMAEARGILRGLKQTADLQRKIKDLEEKLEKTEDELKFYAYSRGPFMR
jgi:hypothetical protein